MTIWLWNLGAYSVQLAVLAVTAAAVTALLRLHTPRATLRFWQLLLAVALVLPLLQPWTTNPSKTIQSSITFMSSAVVDNTPAATQWDPMTLVATVLIAGVAIRFSNPQRHLIGATALIGRRQLSQRIALIAQEVSMSRYRVASLLVLSAAIVAAATLSAASSMPMLGALQAPEVQVHKPGSGITLPVVVKEVKPYYTPEAMEKKIQGSVWLKIVVLPDGTVGDIQITRSLDAEYGLDRAAGKAARQWLFKPGTKDGKPIAVEVTLELTFTLKK